MSTEMFYKYVIGILNIGLEWYFDLLIGVQSLFIPSWHIHILSPEIIQEINMMFEGRIQVQMKK